MSDQEIRFRIVVDDVSAPAAAARTSAAFQRVGDAATRASGQTTAAMRMLPAQLSDVATQIAGGQSPFLVLLQQGLQTRDMFGSFGAAARGLLSLLSPVTGAAVLVAGIGATFFAASRRAGEFRDALALTGNAAGLTQDRLEALTSAVEANSGATVGGARSIILELARQGTVGTRALDSMALAVARVADVSGRDATTVAQDFARMTSGVADWAAEHNKAWNFISVEQYKYIQRLEEQGKAEEAMIFVSEQLTGKLQSQATELGWLERGWQAVAKAASGAWAAMLRVGAAQTLSQQLESLNTQIAGMEEQLASAQRPGSMLSAERRAAAEAQLQALRDDRLQLVRRIDRQTTEAQAAAATAAANRKAIKEAQGEDARKRNGSGSRGPRLDFYNVGQFMGPLPFDPAASFRDFRQSELASTGAVNLEADIRLNRAADQRLKQQQDLLRELTDANERANLDLIADDERRAIAQINLERRQIQERIDAIYGSSSARALAEQQADEAAAAQRQAVAQRFASNTALVTRDEVRDALADAFRDTKNPIRAFGDALGQIVFQRVSSRLADALVSQAFGAAGSVGGDIFGWLLGMASGGGMGPESSDMPGNPVVTGGRAGGGSVMARSAYLVGERGPEVLLMGQRPGFVVPNHALVAPGGGGGMVVHQHFSLRGNEDSRTLFALANMASDQAVARVANMRQRGAPGI